MSFFQEKKKMQEASTETDQLRSKTTRPFASSEGSRYHESTLALVFLRCLRERLQFTLSCNDAAADKFDDLVLCWNDNESHSLCTLLVNVKLVPANRKTISISSLTSQEKANRRKGFDIKMYRDSYEKIRESLDGGSYALVVSTNADLDADARDMFVRVEPEAVPGLELLDAGGSLYQLDPDSEDVKSVVQRDRQFLKHFFLFCNQRGSEEITHTVSTELASLLGATDSWCELMCGSLLSSLRHWMNTQNFYITSSWKSWLDIVDTYIKKEVTTCSSIVTRIKYSNVEALQAFIERHNPAWIRPPGRGAAALTATKLHQIIRGETHIMVSATRLSELQEKVLRCWGPFCRWLVLVDDTENSCDIQHHLMKLVGPERRLIVVSHERDYSFMDTFKSDEICDDTWKELKNVKIQLNSEEYSCCLGDLCDTKALKAMVDEKPEALLALSQLEGPVRMGQDLEPLPQNHIDRQLISRMRVREEFFSTLGEYDVCIMDKLSCNHSTGISFNNTVKYEELENYLCSSNTLWPLLGVTDNIDIPVIQMICSKFQKICVYVLRYEDNGWEILFHHRGSAKIRPYVKEESRSLWQIIDSLSRRIIVDGKPGIGKSTLLLDIARQVKERNPSWWILRINLLTYSEVFNSCSCSYEAVNDILLRVVYNKNIHILELLILLHCLKEYTHIICLVDGFDEICPEYAEKCLHALQQLAPCRGKLVVTTRPSETGRLEAALGVLAHSLPAFTKEELQRFHQGRSSKLGVTDAVVELLKIPLFSRMYAEALESGIVVYDIVSLFETFLERKFRRLYEEKWCEDLSRPGKKRMIERERKNQENHLGFLAVSHLLPKLEVPCAAQTSSIDRDELLRAGVIYQFIDDKAVFIHRNFAEHFLAKWCFSDIGTGHCAKVYQAALCDNSLEFFVEYFDRMASRGRPLLTAVLNGSESEVESLLQEGADPTERDEVGRNSLHLAAAYGRDSALLRLLIDRLEVAGAERVGGSASGPAEGTWEALNEVVVYDMDEKTRLADKERTSESLHVAEASGGAGQWSVAARSPVSAALAAEDGLLQWTPARYAAERRRWGAVAALLEVGLRHLGEPWAPRMLTEIEELLTDRQTDVHAAGLDSNTFQSNTGASAIHLAAAAGRLESIKCLLYLGADVSVRDEGSNTPLHLAATMGSFQSVKLLLEEGATVKTSNDRGDTPLHCAAAVGNADCVRLLVGAKADIEQVNIDGQTPLHLAVLSRKTDCVKELLDAKATVKTSNGRGDTPLHCAAAKGKAKTVKLLQDAGADAEQVNGDGQTPLHLAVLSNDKQCVEVLLEAGVKVNTRNNRGDSPLHCAAAEGLAECVKLLLDAGADVKQVNKHGQTPLHLAILSNDKECVEILLKAGETVTSPDSRGYTPLHCAAAVGSADCVRLLLDANPGTEQVCEYGQTPLHFASLSGDKECVIRLLEAGGKVTTQDKFGNTPLHCAASVGNTEIVKHLLDEGADVEQTNADGQTALHFASVSGDTECVKRLLEAGATLTARNTAGNTPLHCAAAKGSAETVKALLAAGADVESVNEDGDTPLHFASISCDAECLRQLLDVGATVTTRNKRGDTPLHCAAARGMARSVKLLLDARADVEQVNVTGDTPLHLAVLNSDSDCVKTLLDAGASVTTLNKQGYTPLQCAAAKGLAQSVKLLLDAGADRN